MTTGQDEGHLKVLLIDDDPAEYILLKRKLEGATDSRINLDYVENIGAAVNSVQTSEFDMVFLDNRLVPNNDFRETAPQLRNAGFIGPIGIISSDISGPYFKNFQDYGVDFKIGKDEIDGTVINFIVAEYTRDLLSETCSEDYL